MELLFALVLGAATWTFLEYVIHRWLGHSRIARRNPFGIEHIAHHSRGNYFAPAWKKGVAALVIVGTLAVPATALAGAGLGMAYVIGLTGCYLGYELLHRLEHVHGGYGAYGRWARRHHFYHHFHNPRSNHGVTSPFWDHVFGTYARPGVIRVPRRLAMGWLLDPETGEVKPRHARDYEVIGSAPPSGGE